MKKTGSWLRYWLNTCYERQPIKRKIILLVVLGPKKDSQSLQKCPILACEKQLLFIPLALRTSRKWVRVESWGAVPGQAGLATSLSNGDKGNASARREGTALWETEMHLKASQDQRGSQL